MLCPGAMLRPLLALAALLAALPAAANTLIDNVNGIQIGKDGRIERFAAIVIGDDGRIVQVWSAGPKPRGARKTVDMGGRTLLPGLIDAHGHMLDSPGGGAGLGLLLLQLDLVGTSSLADLQQRLKAHAGANPGKGWITGRGWNQELWPDKRFPTAADLDAVVADRPVWLTRVDGHAAVGNSAALKVAGITQATADPPGGRIERGPGGQPTGLFVDNAIALVGGKVPATTPAELDRALDAAQEALLATGLTAVTDMGTSAAGWQAMRRAGEAGRLKLRLIAYADGLDPLRAIGAKQPTDWLFGDRLRLVGVKLYADGALGSRGAWLKRPYADQPDSVGLRFLSDAELRQQAGTAAAMGFQLAIHAIGDAANAQVIGAFERLGDGDRRGRIEHVQVVDPADIPRLARAGIIASMQPTHQTSDRLMAEKRLDPPRLEGAYAWRTILESGARLAFGSDFPVESPNPFPGLSAAISRQDMAGQPPGGWRPEERLTLAQALDGFTRGAAYAGFAEDRIGSLEPGKWADFIIVDRDPAEVDPQALARTEVLETWVAGERVWAKAPSGGPGERGR
jgi:predicted amidohydrolase YtcJ